MPRRKWEVKTKAMIVLEGLKGKAVAELCHEHQIRQAQYYQWRDQLLAHMQRPCYGLAFIRCSGRMG